jgi:branched-chain amino acid aminotransferase
MIWSRGRIISDDALQISVLDRTLEHGLGLFETLRTWNGHPTLLERHLERIARSARELGLSLDPADLPNARAARELIEANREALPPGVDVRLRITLSGGRSNSAVPGGSVVWMSAASLPLALRSSGASITLACQVSEDDPLARHKTLNYWRKRLAQEQAVTCGSDDALCLTASGLICETTRANIFLVAKGRLHTPGNNGPLLPGVMRALVIEHAKRIGIDVVLEPLPRHCIATADEAFLTNSVRGMLPIATLMDRELPSPGPMTKRLWDEILPWLQSGGSTP